MHYICQYYEANFFFFCSKVPRKFSETSSVFSDRSKEGSHSPVGIRGLPPPINTKGNSVTFIYLFILGCLAKQTI